MGQTHRQLIDNFSKGKTKGTASNMFISGDTLYSYGTHFPLLVRREFGYLQNGDRYSHSTSAHQSACRHLATIIIPFSALRTAGIDYTAFRLVDKTKQRYDIIGYYRHVTIRTLTPAQYSIQPKNIRRKFTNNGYSKWDNGNYQGYVEPTEYCLQQKENISVSEYNALTESEKQNWNESTERRPDACIIEYNKRYFLSSMDANQYFICELPRRCKTVQQAYEMLVPEQAKDKEYQRQGEWFVFPCSIPESKQFSNPKQMYKIMRQSFTLPHADSGNPHTATRGIKFNRKYYISGQLKHREHAMLKLSKSDNPVIFQAWQNTALNSWSAGGRVD